MDGKGAKASLPTNACCNRGLEREVFWKCSDGQAFRNKLLSDVSVPPPDCQLKFLGRRESTKQENHRPAREARLERRRFTKRRGQAATVWPWPAHTAGCVFKLEGWVLGRVGGLWLGEGLMGYFKLL